jgi:drug/metabolite transporter (DMT)-like permease
VTVIARKPDQAVVKLTIATLFWGLSFPLTKSWQLAVEDAGWSDALSATTLIALRIGAALVLFILVRLRLVWRPTLKAHAAGLALGLINFSGFILQVVGLASTSPANCGFYTSLASVWTPILAWMALREPVRLPTLIGLGLGIVGAAVLGIKTDEGWLWEAHSFLPATWSSSSPGFGASFAGQLDSPAPGFIMMMFSGLRE